MTKVVMPDELGAAVERFSNDLLKIMEQMDELLKRGEKLKDAYERWKASEKE